MSCIMYHIFFLQSFLPHDYDVDQTHDVGSVPQLGTLSSQEVERTVSYSLQSLKNWFGVDERPVSTSDQRPEITSLLGSWTVSV